MRPRRDLVVLIVLCSLVAAASALYSRRSSIAISKLQIVSAKGVYCTSVEVTQSFFDGHSAVVSYWMEGCGTTYTCTKALPPEILEKFLRSADLEHFRAKEGATRICFQDRDYIEIKLVDGSGSHYYAGDGAKNAASVQAAKILFAYVGDDYFQPAGKTR